MKWYLILPLLALPLQAADQAGFELIGFSSDGGSAAWRTGGIHDGSGFPWCRVEVIDCMTGLPAAEEYRVIDYETDITEEEMLEETGKDLLDRYSIEARQFCNPLVYHPVTDLGASPDTVRFCLEQFFPGYTSGELVMTLSLKEVEGSVGYPDWFPPPVTPRLLLNGEAFFSEQKPPEGYASMFEYRIAAIYRNPVREDLLLVVLHAEQPGFEGADGRYRVVSGYLP